MKQLTEKITITALIAGMLFLLFGDAAPKTAATGENSEVATDAFYVSAPVSEKRVVYQCRLGNEEIPAVQIREAKAPNGRVTETSASVNLKSGIEVTIPETAPTWDYKSIAARSASGEIEVAFKPNGARRGFDWTLTLTDKNVNFKKRVRDCMEVADE